MYTALRFTAGTLFAALLLASVSFVTPVHAQSITNEQVREQQRTVMFELVGVLEEQVKLLQMLYIQRLEANIARLEAQVSTQ